jgi:hypothetical protein
VDTYRWTPTIPAVGTYEVYVRWTAYSTRSSSVPIAVTHAGGTTTKTYDQRTGGGVWVLHGTYGFNAGTGGYVQVSDVNGQACADVVKFVPAAALPTVTVTATDPTAAENPLDTGVFTVSRTGGTAAALTVSYTVGGTATPGSDYTALGGSVTILAGSATATVTVTPVNDTQVEGEETVVLTLSAGAGYAVGTPSSATVTIASDDVGEIILDNAPAGQTGGGRSYTGTWLKSSASGAYGPDSLYSNGSGVDTYRWTPTIPAAGTYEVYVRWTAYSTRSSSVPVAVNHAGGKTTVSYNQKVDGGKWVLHGTYSFNAGTGGYVEVSESAATGQQACADAVRFVPSGAPPTEIILDNAPAGTSGGGRSFTGSWCNSTTSGFYGTDSLYSCGSDSTYRWTPTIPAAGSYEVYVWWTAHTNRSVSVPITVNHAGGPTTNFYNQKVDGGKWVLHGTYSFNAGEAGSVEVWGGLYTTGRQACADAVKFVRVP